LSIEDRIRRFSLFSAARSTTASDIRLGKTNHKTSAFRDGADAFTFFESRRHPFFRTPIVDGFTSMCVYPLESTQDTVWGWEPTGIKIVED
jgi:hypothetical protein